MSDRSVTPTQKSPYRPDLSQLASGSRTSGQATYTSISDGMNRDPDKFAKDKRAFESVPNINVSDSRRYMM
jgi:hypothetical protein